MLKQLLCLCVASSAISFGVYAAETAPKAPVKSPAIENEIQSPAVSTPSQDDQKDALAGCCKGKGKKGTIVVACCGEEEDEVTQSVDVDQTTAGCGCKDKDKNKKGALVASSAATTVEEEKVVVEPQQELQACGTCGNPRHRA